MDDRKHKDAVLSAKIQNGYVPASFQVSGPLSSRSKGLVFYGIFGFHSPWKLYSLIFNVSTSSKCLSNV